MAWGQVFFFPPNPDWESVDTCKWNSFSSSGIQQFASSGLNIVKKLVILLIVTSTPCPLAMLMGVHLVSCFRLSVGKKGTQVSLSPSHPGNREFIVHLIFRGLWRAWIEWLELINSTSPSGCIIHLAEQLARQWTHCELCSCWSTSVISPCLSGGIPRKLPAFQTQKLAIQ